MTKKVEERLDLWLNYCKTYGKFEKFYKKMISEMRLDDVSKFKRFEEIQSEWSRKGAKKYTLFEINDYSPYDTYCKLIVGKNDTRYELSVFDKNINDITERVYGLTENKIDCDCVALLIYDDGNLQNHCMLEVDIVKNGTNYYLVCREWVNLKIVNKQIFKKFSQEEVDILLDENIKQI